MSEEKNVKEINELKELELRFLKTRNLFIFGEIDQEMAEKVSRQLLLLQDMGDEPIKIYLNSQGGHVESGDTIYDMIRFISPKVYIIGTGWVASAGVTIYLAVDKEDRFSLPNTRYMIHQPLGGSSGQVSDIAIETNELVRVRERINRLISEATGQPLDRVQEDTDRNYWLSNEQAQEYGIVGKIITSVKDIPEK